MVRIEPMNCLGSRGELLRAARVIPSVGILPRSVTPSEVGDRHHALIRIRTDGDLTGDRTPRRSTQNGPIEGMCPYQDSNLGRPGSAVAVHVRLFVGYPIPPPDSRDGSCFHSVARLGHSWSVVDLPIPPDIVPKRVPSRGLTALPSRGSLAHADP